MKNKPNQIETTRIWSPVCQTVIIFAFAFSATLFAKPTTSEANAAATPAPAAAAPAAAAPAASTLLQRESPEDERIRDRCSQIKDNDAYRQCVEQIRGTPNRVCERAERAFDEAVTQIRGCTQANCLKKVVACADDEESIGATFQWMNAFNPTGCESALQNTACPERNAGTLSDFNTQLKDAESRAKDARREQQEAQKDLVKVQKDFRETEQDLEKRAKDAERAIRDKQQKATEDLQNALRELDAKKAAALEETQKRFDAIDVEYIELRDKVRRDISKVADKKMEHTVTCRADAEDRYEKAEAALLKRIEEENSVTKNQNFADAAGYFNRQNREKREKLKTNYNGFFEDCMSGTSGAGSAALAAIAAAEREKADNERKMIDVAARLEKIRQEQLERLRQIEQMVEQNKQTIIRQLEQQIRNMQEDYQRLMQDNMKAYQDAVQDHQEQMTLAQAKLQSASQELYSANMERMTSHSRVQCARISGGSLSASTGEKRLKNYEEIRSALPRASNACWTMRNNQCSGYKQSACKGYSTAIEDYNRLRDEDQDNKSGGTAK